MCGRFSQAFTWEEIVAFSQPLTVPAERANLQPHYNLAPTDTVRIIVKTPLGRELIPARWGLIPPWHKGRPNEVGATFNARVESVATKPTFRSAFRSRRCIIPASGFFEWTGPKGDKTPHFISAADGALLAFAGLWERWKDPETGQEIISCTIIVRDPVAGIATLHDRMPCMLHPRDFDAWLDGSAGEKLLMDPPPALRDWIVDRRVNKSGVGDDDPETITPVG